MSEKPSDFPLYLPAENGGSSKHAPADPTGPRPLRKFTARLASGKTIYDLKHNLATQDVVVQTRIAGNLRDGGISVIDANTVRIQFGGPLHEPMDVVIIG